MLQPGSQLHGMYLIERLLGAGGMGRVYVARQTTLGGRLVAIKEMNFDVVEPDQRGTALEQFAREAETLASSDHPNLVDVKDFFEDNGAHYLVMSYIDGVSLEAVVNSSPEFLPCARVLEWMDPVCDVLAFLHRRHPPIIVRDLKPANIMLDTKGRLRLIDFGIARSVPPGSHTATYVKGVGTVGYAPLEQYGDTGTDARSDIYALGATIYSLVTRTVPAWSVGRATGDEPMRPAGSINPEVSPQLDAVIEKMMAIRVQDRYRDVEEARTALREAARTVPPAPPLPGTRYCSNCGASAVPALGRCHHCHSPFDDQAETLQPAGPTAPHASGPSTPASPPPPPPPSAPPPPPPSTPPPPPWDPSSTPPPAPPWADSSGTPPSWPQMPTARPVAPGPHDTPPTVLSRGSPPPQARRSGPNAFVLLLACVLAAGLIYAATQWGGRSSGQGGTSPSPRSIPDLSVYTPSVPSFTPETPPRFTPPEPRFTPTPESTPTPELESTPTPELESTPAPELDSTPAPEPSATLEPELTPTPVPSPEETPTPRPPPPPPRSPYLMSSSSTDYVTASDLAGKDARTVCLIRNEIFARRHITFRLPAVRAYFESQSWYRADPRFNADRPPPLNAIERRNVEFILKYENAHNMRWPY